MGAAGRLWRRAPAWRTALVVAASATILAVLYPPLPRRVPPSAISRYTPLTPMAVVGPAYVDVLSFEGRWIPLPKGAWRGVTQVRTKSEPPVIGGMFVRLNGSELTGILVIEGTAAPSETLRAFPLSPLCTSSAAYAARMIVPHDWVQHECWSILPAFLPADWSAPKTAPVYRHGLQRLLEGNIAAPATLIGAAWFEADDRTWLSVQYFFNPATDPSVPKDPAAWKRSAALGNPEASRYIDRLKVWSKNWTPLLEKGATAELLPAEIEAVASSPEN